MQETSNSLKTLKGLLNAPDGILRKLIAKADCLSKLTIEISEILPTELSASCLVTRYHQGILTISAKTGYHASQLRFYHIHILSYLRSKPEWAQVRNLRFSILFPEETLISKKDLTSEPPAQKGPKALSPKFQVLQKRLFTLLHSS